MTYGFSKQDRLCGDLKIREVNRKGQRLTAWPLRAVALKYDGNRTQVMVWAPKSLFKHAVDRNKLRRLMREAYRLEAQPYLQQASQKYLITIYYCDKNIQSFRTIAKAMKKLVSKL